MTHLSISPDLVIIQIQTVQTPLLQKYKISPFAHPQILFFSSSSLCHKALIKCSNCSIQINPWMPSKEGISSDLTIFWNEGWSLCLRNVALHKCPWSSTASRWCELFIAVSASAGSRRRVWVGWRVECCSCDMGNLDMTWKWELLLDSIIYVTWYDLGLPRTCQDFYHAQKDFWFEAGDLSTHNTSVLRVKTSE